MLKLLIVLGIGVFVGWNLPQPDWAVYAQAKITEFFKNLVNKTDNNDDNK